MKSPVEELLQNIWEMQQLQSRVFGMFTLVPKEGPHGRTEIKEMLEGSSNDTRESLQDEKRSETVSAVCTRPIGKATCREHQ